MKTLLIMAGLPASGKSHWCRRVTRWLPSIYFDSDLWAKRNQGHIDFENWSQKKITQARVKAHRKKLGAILDCFQQTDIVLVDTCFDVPESRKLFYALEPKINIIIVEFACSMRTAKRRMERHHEEERMPGSKEGRWKGYLHMVKHWRPIRWKRHHTINTDYPEFLVRRKIKRILKKEGLL